MVESRTELPAAEAPEKVSALAACETEDEQEVDRVRPPPREMLRQAGFVFFGQFLKSSKFASIRRRVLAASKNACAHCGRPACLIHWLEFTVGNLRGSDLKGIDAVCRRCLDEWSDAE